MKNKIIRVQDIEVTISAFDETDYISLTDMAKAKANDSRAADVIKNWLRNRSTLEFIGTWEMMYNPRFKVVEFDHFKMQAGLPTFVLSASQWIEATNAKGIYVKNGRYGGTYAHKDIAFEFGSAISPVFKLYLIKEYQRLKEIENKNQLQEWDVKRLLSKTNYLIHTDAIRKHIIPAMEHLYKKDWLVYADEADLLNVALFGYTAKEWREANPDVAKKGLNIRDIATINELTVLSNLETHNAEWIKKEINKAERFNLLQKIADYQLHILNNADLLKNPENKELKDDG